MTILKFRNNKSFIFRLKTKIAKYREMANYTEITNALDMVLDEAISKDSKGNSFQFEILIPQKG